MEVVVRQKRAREETDGVLVDGPVSKRLFEGSGMSVLFDVDEHGEARLSSSSDDIHSLSSSEVLSSEALQNGESVGAESETALEETLRSLQEELGVSGGSVEYPVPAPHVEELPGSALASWGDEIWDVHGFSSQENDALLTSQVGSSSGNRQTASESLPNSDLAIFEDREVCDASARVRTSVGHDRFSAVDIGFLLEASDDELGIPPSPSDEREQSSEQDQVDQDCARKVGTAEAVSWALEGGGDNLGFYDTNIEDWMMGNLDFMMETPAAYSAISPLVEAGLVL